MSRKAFLLAGMLVFLAGLVFLSAPLPPAAHAAGTEWAANTTVIEACSCPMFCQCYFNSAPAGHSHHGGAPEHYCRANLAHRINKGHYGSVKLDGVKFWVASDLGPDFSKGQMDWAVLTFDKAMTKEQRDAVAQIVGHVFPVKWNSLSTAEANIDVWEYTKDSARAAMDGGKTAEVQLKRFPGYTAEPVVIKNLPYWGVKRHEGFVLMPNEVEAYRVGPKAFEYKGTNGFMITWDMTSADVPPAKN
jgi:Protein of unknown function (DUF1326)